MLGKRSADELPEWSRRIRVEIIKMVAACRSGHPSGALSIADILACLYFRLLNVDPGRPDWENRDRFVLSKGHSCPALYAALALRGFFPVDELRTLRAIDSRLQGHPAVGTAPGLDFTTGSLGQGVSAALGIALAARVLGRAYRVYAIMSDGEQAEGQVWEMAMAAAHFRAGNLTCFIDRNGVQTDGATSHVMSSASLEDKYAAFGWNVRTCDGHDHAGIVRSALEVQDDPVRPGVVICDTVQGKGCRRLEAARTELYGEQLDEQHVRDALADLGEEVA